MTENQIASEIAAYILRHGTKFSDWTVGTTPSVANLLVTHSVPPSGNWIARDTKDPMLAVDVAVYFQSFGCDGVTTGAPDFSTIVFAVHKASGSAL